MANERNTENLVRGLLKEKGYYSDKTILVEEQQSKKPTVERLLKNASKKGEGVGRPEFIITKGTSDVIVVIECKAKPTDQKSINLDIAADYAVDGAIHYASYLAKDFDVVAIGVSGENEKELVIDTFTYNKNGSKAVDKNIKEFRTFNEYTSIIKNTVEKKAIEVAELVSFAKELHEFLYAHVSLPTGKKMLLISGMLLALQDSFFRTTFMKIESEKIVDKMVAAIEDVLEKANIKSDKAKVLMHNFEGLRLSKELAKDTDTKAYKGNPLKDMLKGIADNVYPVMKSQNDIDVMGRFYGEFIRYTVGDGKDGFVLTPQHVTNLFAELADLTPQSRVLDNCTGTGGFLIAAMTNELKKANGDTALEEHIKKNNLHGVEMDPDRFSLACTNMILRGDGQSNLIEASCLDDSTKAEMKLRKCSVGLINPPYSLKGEGQSELDFINNLLDCLEPNGLAFAIVPMSCAIDTKKQMVALKERILSKHTLEGVMSMPEELFYPVGVVTCIMVFRAGVPHDSTRKSWFGFWKDDGFIKTKKDGRVDLNHLWENEIKDKWVKAFKNRDEIVGFSVKKEVTANDEWCAEAYMQTDYSKLTKEMFEEEVKKYAIFKLMNE